MTLTNSGMAVLMIQNITITGLHASDFSQTNNCGNSVVAGASCTITISFSPSAPAPRAAFVTVTDSAVGSPHNISVVGLGANVGTIAVSTSSLTFGDQAVGSTSPLQLVTLENLGKDDIIMVNVAFAGQNPDDFAQKNDCPFALGPGKKCHATVTFTPTDQGNRSASLRFKNTAAGSPQLIGLTGTGVAALSLRPSLASARSR